MSKYEGKLILIGVGFMPTQIDMDAIVANRMDVVRKLAVDSGNQDISGLLPFHATNHNHAMKGISDNEPQGFGLKEDKYRSEKLTVSGKQYILAMATTICGEHYE